MTKITEIGIQPIHVPQVSVYKINAPKITPVGIPVHVPIGFPVYPDGWKRSFQQRPRWKCCDM